MDAQFTLQYSSEELRRNINILENTMNYSGSDVTVLPSNIKVEVKKVVGRFLFVSRAEYVEELLQHSTLPEQQYEHSF